MDKTVLLNDDSQSIRERSMLSASDLSEALALLYFFYSDRCSPSRHRLAEYPFVYKSDFLPPGSGGFKIDSEHSAFVTGTAKMPDTLIVDPATYRKLRDEGLHVCK